MKIAMSPIDVTCAIVILNARLAGPDWSTNSQVFLLLTWYRISYRRQTFDDALRVYD